MNESWPNWTTEITDNTVVGEDQLGVEGAAQAYQQNILPGITTVTNHVRYYSYYAWILYRYIILKSSARLKKDFQDSFFKRHEMALIFASYSHHMNGKSLSNLVGSDNISAFWDLNDPLSLDRSYFKNSEGGFGQYYRTAMQAMGILDLPDNPRWIYCLTDRGKALAEAYKKSISGTQYHKKLETNEQLTQLSRKDALEYGKAGCICPAALNSGADRNLLLDTFFRFEYPQDYKNSHVRRRNSLGVALDLVHQANKQFHREMLRPALYIGEYYPGLLYKPSEDLKDWVKRWQMVEVRHLFCLGFQCLWAAFLLELASSVDLNREEWQAWVITQLNEKGWNISLKQLSEKLCDQAGIAGTFDDLLHTTQYSFGLQSGLDEYSLYLRAIRNQTNSTILFQTGVSVLVQLYLRYFQEYSTQNPIWVDMAERERLPINPYFRVVENRLQNNEWSVRDWLSWVYQEYIFEQHEMMALEKLRYQEYDTFKFYYEENTFHWPTGKKYYTEPIRLAANRLNNCLTMLIDLGLIQENPDKTLVLTSEGKKYHGQVMKALCNDD